MSSRPFPRLSLVALLVIVSTLLVQPKVVASLASYHPTGYNLLDTTAYVSGELTDLHSDNGVYMAFGSYVSQTSAQTLYAVQKATTIAGTNYYRSGLESADDLGESLSASMASTGRKLWGKFVYPLTGVAAISASLWTSYYRTWYSGMPENIVTDSPTSAPVGSWSDKMNALSSDNQYAYTDVHMATQQYGSYKFEIPSVANVTRVEVGYEAYAEEDERIGVTLSWNKGATWVPPYISPQLNTTDQNTVTWVDFTNATSWNSDKLSMDNLRTATTGIQTGENMNQVYLDWISVRVTYFVYPSAHADVDILIRKSDGTVRHTIATNAAISANLTATPQTLSGTYSWQAYAVMDETDYLEMDYYLDVTTADPDATAYLRIGDNTLSLVDQTRTTNIILPSEYTVEVEFTGSSNTDHWTQLVWTVDSCWTTSDVSVILQLYDYSLGAYSVTGDGYISYASSAASKMDETSSQNITLNSKNFRDASGNWKMKIKGVKSTALQFEFEIDFIKYAVTTVAPPDVAVLSVTVSSSSVFSGDVVMINITVKNEGGIPETFNVTLYYDSNAIGTQTVTGLEPETETTLKFSWDTTDAAPGVVYLIKAEASGVEGETDSVDNTYVHGTIEVRRQVPSNPFGGDSILPYLSLFLLGGLGFSFAGIWWKKRETGIGFEFFNELVAGGIPDAYSVMITGDAGSGKSVLSQQLAYEYLTQGKSCIYVTYDIFPSEVRQNMKSFNWNASLYEKKGNFTLVDCYSSTAGQDSEEKYYIEQPFVLSDLGITLSTVMEEAKHRSTRIFLDSTTPLFARVDASKVTEFLQDRSARIKGNKGVFLFTVGKGTVPSGLMKRLDEIVDCIIDLNVYEEKGKTKKRMRIRKLRGQKVTDTWIPFRIELKKGITFLPPKGIFRKEREVRKLQ
jgi:flagellar protein FlaH